MRPCQIWWSLLSAVQQSDYTVKDALTEAPFLSTYQEWQRISYYLKSEYFTMRRIPGAVSVEWVGVIAVKKTAAHQLQLQSDCKLLNPQIFVLWNFCAQHRFATSFWLIWHTYQWAYATMICPSCVVVIGIVIIAIFVFGVVVIGVICVQLSQ